MQIRFTCRQTRLTPALRDFTTEKVDRLARYLDDDAEVHVVLTVEKRRHQAEMVISSGRRHLTGTAITDDLYGAISLVLEKIGKQLRRAKRRRTDQRRRTARVPAASGANGQGAAGRRRLRLLPEPQAAKPMSLEEAADDLAASEMDFLVFRNAESDRMSVIYRRADGRLGLIEGV